MKPTQQPPAQQPRNNIAQPFKFCWYDIFRGPYVESTGGNAAPDLTPYEFPAADKVNPVGDAKYDVPKPKR